MLSPHTPPGTLVVCVNNGPLVNSHRIIMAAPELVEGRVYTLAHVRRVNHKTFGEYFGVHLQEVVANPNLCGFNPARFKPAVLPKALTDCLVVENIPTEIKNDTLEDA